jgi:hypothetical protein
MESKGNLHTATTDEVSINTTDSDNPTNKYVGIYCVAHSQATDDTVMDNFAYQEAP